MFCQFCQFCQDFIFLFKLLKGALTLKCGFWGPELIVLDQDELDFDPAKNLHFFFKGEIGFKNQFDACRLIDLCVDNNLIMLCTSICKYFLWWYFQLRTYV
jgi:hypothetical protein